MVFKGRNINIIKDERIRECNYGDYNGMDNKLVDYSSHIEKKFSRGENRLDVEKRIKNFLDDLKDKCDGKKVAIVAHKAPQLAVEVIVNDKTWKEAIEKYWRLAHSWQPGWRYIIK